MCYRQRNVNCSLDIFSSRCKTRIPSAMMGMRVTTLKSRGNPSRECFSRGKDPIRHDRVGFREECQSPAMSSTSTAYTLRGPPSPPPPPPPPSKASVQESNSRHADRAKNQREHRRDVGRGGKRRVQERKREGAEGRKSGGRQSAKPPVSRYKQSQFPPSVRAAGKDFACATTKRQYSAPGPCDRVVVGAKLRR